MSSKKMIGGLWRIIFYNINNIILIRMTNICDYRTDIKGGGIKRI